MQAYDEDIATVFAAAFLIWTSEICEFLGQTVFYYTIGHNTLRQYVYIEKSFFFISIMDFKAK